MCVKQTFHGVSLFFLKKIIGKFMLGLLGFSQFRFRFFQASR